MDAGRPQLSHVAERLYEGLAPVAWADHEHDYALAHFAQALAKMVDEVADLSRDSEDGAPGWSILFDPDRVPAKFLPWLGQFIGVRIPGALPEAAQRERLRSTDGFRRGTVGAIVGAAQQYLTGSKRVYLTERHGSAYRLTVATIESETPNPELVEAALREQKPAGIVLTHSVVPGGDFNTLRDTHSDFDDVKATFATFDEVRDNPAKQR